MALASFLITVLWKRPGAKDTGFWAYNTRLGLDRKQIDFWMELLIILVFNLF